MRRFIRFFQIAAIALAACVTTTARGEEIPSPEVGEAPTADTTILVDDVQVTAIKQGRVLRQEPLAASILGSREVARRHVDALKSLSSAVPNLHIPDYGSRMTSSVYVRGLGARIDQPVIGLNIDNVPVLNKNAFDIELADIERIEVLRGPQSTLYGRNTMGGVVNIYTLSPLHYEGVRLLAEYGSGETWRLRASTYQKLRPNLGIAVTGFYTRSGGLFENRETDELCDWERMGGGRWKVQWRGAQGWQIENTLALSEVEQGGYPYVYIGDALRDEAGGEIIRPGEIRYNDPAGYRRTMLSEGLTVRHDGDRTSVASITSYQYSDDEMILDQDFLPLSYFTLRQATREHALTEDLVIRSRTKGRYRWMAGLFGLFRQTRMEAPVDFKEQGIDELIFRNANEQMAPLGISYEKSSNELPLHSDFRNRIYGGAVYHESQLHLGRWRLTAGLRFDVEHTQLGYHSLTEMAYTLHEEGAAPRPMQIRIDETNSVAHTYTELLPKVAVSYSFDDGRNLYLSVSKGYKAGGFNTQMFSDILQEKLKWRMVGSSYRESDVMSYRPEYSWNYELGGRFSCLDGDVRGDFALFWIDCRDQQLTVFPAGQTTGRMMTNAGRTRSLGGELSLQLHPWRQLEMTFAYGFTDARFRHYVNTVKDEAGRPVVRDYRGKRLPYAPRHTLSARAAWSIESGIAWLGKIIVSGGARCAGEIYWNEENSRCQPFYALLDASVRIEQRHYSIDLWSRNLGNTVYEVFYFKSIGNEFVQRGHPRTFGITLSLNILD